MNKELFTKLQRFSAFGLVCVTAGALFACKTTVGANTPEPTAAITAEPAPTASKTAAPTDAPTPTPEPTEVPTPEPTPEPLSIAFRDIELAREVKYDYFAIPEEVLVLMSEGDRELYRRVAAAYFSYENEVEIPAGMEAHENLWRVIDMYFPLFFADVSDETIVEENGTIRWEYMGSSEEHEKAIADFEERIGELLDPVVESDSFIMQVLTVYKTLTSCIVYNGININGEDPDGSSEVPYVYRHTVNAIIDKTGVCWCFARAYNFLICQLGAESLTVHGLRKGDNAIHEWTVFRYQDEWRYADPTWDLGGNSLYFFGFTRNARTSHGYPDNNVSVLEGDTYRASEYFTVDGTFYKDLYTGKCSGDTYELDHENGLIVFYDISYNIFGEEVARKLCTFDPETAKYQFFD